MDISALPIHILFVALLSLRNGFTKKLCTRKFHKIENATFFQRTELSSAESCVERCIEMIELCKAAVFSQKKGKINGFCYLYTANSESPEIEVVIDGTLDPISTVFEILNKCQVSIAVQTDRIVEKISADLREKLDKWDDNSHKASKVSEGLGMKEDKESSPDELPPNVITKVDNKPYVASDRNNLNLPKFPTEATHERTEYRPRFEASEHSHRPGYIGAPGSGGYVPSARTFESEGSGRYASDPYSTSKIQQNSTPIKPSQVLYGGRPVLCSGANCYAPAIASQPQIIYVQPCPAQLGDPCAPKPQPPCVQPPESPCPSAAVLKEMQESEVVWSPWSVPTPCSVTCGIGVVQRRRVCQQEGQCSGDAIKEEKCERPPCEEWAEWSEWSGCSRSCGGGEQERSRICITGRNCMGPSKTIQLCSEEPCAEWTDWENWGSCSVTCGTGRQRRFRQCLGGLACEGRPVEEKLCDAGLCPAWSQWQPWSECSRSCGGGDKFRKRNCIGGSNCEGSDVETVLCNQNTCPDWSPWTPWTECSETCGESGTKLRTRQCLYDNARSDFCEGPAQDQAQCRLQPCPEWTEWGEWTECSVSCGHGQQTRSRKCSLGACVGSDKEYRFCQEVSCPYWDQWSEWSGCSVTCGIGTCERRRKCVRDDVPSLPSIDDVIKEVEKDDIKSAAKATLIESNRNRFKSKIDHGDQGPLSASLQRDLPSEVLVVVQSNTTIRRAPQKNPFSSDGCTGPEYDQKQCDAGPCCGLTEWSQWTPCSVTCGGGKRTRHRKCAPEGSFAEPEPLPVPHHYSRPISRPLLKSEPQPRIKPALLQVSQHPASGYASPALVATPANYFGASYQYSSPVFAGLQPIIPVKQFSRPRRQTFNIMKFGPSTEDRMHPACHCDGETFEEETCNDKPCAASIKCSWSHWGEWCGCTGPCNLGTRVRNRYCDVDSSLSDVGQRKPAFPDPTCHCEGEPVQTSNCIPSDCLPTAARGSSAGGTYSMSSSYHTAAHIDESSCRWSSWNEWSSCEGGKKSRTRMCIGISPSNRCQCNGAVKEMLPCGRMHGESQAEYYSTAQVLNDENRGAESCNWSEWSRWTECSSTCGPGDKMRRRFCTCRSCGSGASSEIHTCEVAECEPEKMFRRNPFD